MRKLLNILILLLLFTLSGCYSCQSWNNLWGKGPVEPGCEHKFFFDKDCRLLAKAPAKPAPAPVKPKPAPVSECGPSNVLRSYPCKGCEIIQLNKTMPSEVQLNATFDYTIKVTNVTDMAVANVVVTENIPGNLNVKNSNPAATKDGGKLVWKLGSFAPKQSKRITVSRTATNTECIQTCASATYIVVNNPLLPRDKVWISFADVVYAHCNQLLHRPEPAAYLASVPNGFESPRLQ